MGIRRGRPGLRRAAVLLLAALAGCGLSKAEQARLDVHKANASDFFSRSDYQRALQQANKAIALDPDDATMALVRAHCLLRIGTATRNGVLIDESIGAFEEMRSQWPDDDRSTLGLGSAQLARALSMEDEIARAEKRLESEFLADTGRKEEQDRITAAQEARVASLHDAETALREVLSHELQKDNPIAVTDLVLVLHAEGGRDAEAEPLADQALRLLDENSSINQTKLDKNPRLSPGSKLELEQQIKNNKEKELSLRDLLATAALQRGDTDGFLTQMQLLEDRGLLDEVQYWNRAGVYEKLGRLDLAVADLESYLRLRSRRFTSYEQDDRAPEVFRRIEVLRERQAATTPR
ncbi:MAG TPA: tetratricopeptide repeat protein [Planctomycetota bacterium]|nr:tetratricopeptide repeat protein [Planctomycetota bacterium]